MGSRVGGSVGYRGLGEEGEQGPMGFHGTGREDECHLGLGNTGKRWKRDFWGICN